MRWISVGTTCHHSALIRVGMAGEVEWMSERATGPLGLAESRESLVTLVWVCGPREVWPAQQELE